MNYCRIDKLVISIIEDVRDSEALSQAMLVIIKCDSHGCASLVRDSYSNPVDTYAINVMGTVHVLEAVRSCKSVKAVVNVTTDSAMKIKNGYGVIERMNLWEVMILIPIAKDVQN